MYIYIVTNNFDAINSFIDIITFSIQYHHINLEMYLPTYVYKKLRASNFISVAPMSIVHAYAGMTKQRILVEISKL